jgi:hypothetical protein
MGKTILHVFLIYWKKSLKLLFPESTGKLWKTILNVFFNKDKIMNKSPRDPPHQMSSNENLNTNLNRNFLFKCRSEFHIMLWPQEIEWDNNKEKYFCRWLHREN